MIYYYMIEIRTVHSSVICEETYLDYYAYSYYDLGFRSELISILFLVLQMLVDLYGEVKLD